MFELTNHRTRTATFILFEKHKTNNPLNFIKKK